MGQKKNKFNLIVLEVNLCQKYKNHSDKEIKKKGFKSAFN